MRTISENFREALRGIRELNALVTYQSEDTSFAITTEIGQDITTELSEIITTELGDIIYQGEQIIKLNPLFSVELFKTMCKSVAIETRSEIPVGTWLNVKIGVMVGNSYEFLDFGDYLITECKYEADTNSYNILAYDKMVEAMIPYDLSITYPITIKNLLINIFTKLGWEYELEAFINQDKTLTKDLFSNQDLTFRDVLDNISQVIVGNIGFDGKVAKIKYIVPLGSSTQIPFEIPQTLNVFGASEDNYITEQDLKDTNVTINEKYGPLNSIIITQNDVVLNNLQDSTSVEENGLTQYDFKNNLILMNDSDTFINDMFNGIKGLEYYIYDFDTFGKLYFEPLDEVMIKIGDNEYKSIILNDDIKLTTGLEETYYFDTPEDTTPEYIAVDKNEKKINNALISIDKANAEIVLKVDSQGKIAKVELSGDGDDGTRISIDADQLDISATDVLNLLAGNSINLTSKNITINSNNFNVDTNGNLTCSNANISGTITSSNANITGGGIKVTNKSATSNTPFMEISDRYTYNGVLSTEINTCVIDMQNLATDGGAAVEPVIRLYSSVLGSTQVGAGGIYTSEVITDDLYVSGTKNRVVSLDNGKRVLINAYETATPYFGDIGSNKTNKNGYCKIDIEEIFGQTIERDDYKVFIQECGEGNLYVEKSKNYFEVKGTPNLDFDWELKAIQKGFKDTRLEEFIERNNK